MELLLAFGAGVALMALARAFFNPPPQRVVANDHDILERAPIGLLIIDSDDHLIFANNLARQLGLDTLGIGRQGSSTIQLAEKILHIERSDLGNATAIYAYDDSKHHRLEAARRDVVANITHELKTPVGSIALLAEALRHSLDEPEQAENFSQQLYAEAHRLGEMISELIALSQLQSARPGDNMQLEPLDEIISLALMRNQLAADNAHISLNSETVPGLKLYCDASLLATALSNLISNAIHYSPAGSTVWVSTISNNEGIDIVVRDQGIGIAQRYHERIFERFFRVDVARSRATGGTGLGLAIVKHIAHIHHAQIRVESAENKGSTFILSFPPGECRGGEQ
ncbi:ATP-binding protein [Corynebacterium sp. ES2730-CONJ]|uniref:sensor histidine kinase n=1 Tax=Corynebacterium sp. ES2730-CONJ TaxID=2973941 RepID=UPI00216ABCAD|nr:ATP-binding protein [Corynebacterium sp. ES2730-CONJ]MCS4531642.1 ATP-binding protein [Corynebacterium sp. ES2730-CONJ]